MLYFHFITDDCFVNVIISITFANQISLTQSFFVAERKQNNREDKHFATVSNRFPLLLFNKTFACIVIGWENGLYFNFKLTTNNHNYPHSISKSDFDDSIVIDIKRKNKTREGRQIFRNCQYLVCRWVLIRISCQVGCQTTAYEK